MTSVVIWLNRESGDSESLWAVADSRITHQTDNGGIKRSLEIFPKIYELELKVRVDPRKFSREKVHSLGMAIAGNVLLSMAVKNTVEYLFGYLTLLNSQDMTQYTFENLRRKLPPIEHVVYLVNDIAKQVMYSHVKNTSNRKEKFEICIFGYCPIKQSYEAYKIVCQTFNNSKYQEVEGSLECFENSIDKKIFNIASDDLQFMLLGDKTPEIQILIEDEIEQCKLENRDFYRAPMRVMQKIVDEEEYMATIGSYAQHAIADTHFVRVGGGVTPKTGISFFGYRLGNLDQYGQAVTPLMGECFISPPAICF